MQVYCVKDCKSLPASMPVLITVRVNIIVTFGITVFSVFNIAEVLRG